MWYDSAPPLRKKPPDASPGPVGLKSENITNISSENLKSKLNIKRSGQIRPKHVQGQQSIIDMFKGRKSERGIPVRSIKGTLRQPEDIVDIDSKARTLKHPEQKNDTDEARRFQQDGSSRS